jgi:hypothetical protein
MNPNQQIAIAYHEAGHAVIGRVLGLVCGDATLSSSEHDALGDAHVERRWRWREREYGAPKELAEAFCIALYAGAEAERVILGDANENLLVGDGVDQERATHALIDVGGVRGASYVCDDVWERHEARLRRKAKALVQQHRAVIERVAKALIEHGTLRADEIDKIVPIRA